MRSRKRPIAVDLCSGAGGMSLGFEQAGFDVLAAVEIDPAHCATHEFNFPHSKVICGDISKLTGKKIRELSGIGDADIAVVFGGLPCQGVSVIGKRSVDDPRNALGRDFIRLVHELNAQYFVIENVRGLTFERNRKILNTIVNSCVRRGYKIEKNYKVLNASHFGIPQNRERLFLLGCKKELSLPAYPEVITQSLRIEENAALFKQLSVFDQEKIKELPFCPTVFDALGDLPEAENYPVLLEQDWVEAEYGKPSQYSELLRGLRFVGDDYSYPRSYNPTILTSSLRANHSEETVQRFEATPPGKQEKKSRLHRLHPEGISHTLRAGTASNYGSFTAPRPIHYANPRCITVREAARLHSYPDWFRFHVTNWHGMRQVGNSVPPLLAKAVAAEVVRALDVQPKKPTQSIQLGAEELLVYNVQEAAIYYGVDPNVIQPRSRKKKTQSQLDSE